MFVMFEIEFVLHKNITSSKLDEIINVKSIAWPYSYESQLDWLSKNLKADDIHVLLYLDNLLVAYLNLIEIEFSLDEVSKNGYGIGNVCAVEKGKGYGTELIMKTNYFLFKNGQIGLLFCKENLIKFYDSNKWKLIERSKVYLPFDNELIYIMTFNLAYEVISLRYYGKVF